MVHEIRVPIIRSLGKAIKEPLKEPMKLSPVALRYVEEVIAATPWYAKCAGVVAGVGVYIAMPDTGKKVAKKVVIKMGSMAVDGAAKIFPL